MTLEELTRHAYDAYCKQAGGVTFDNKPLPTFEELGTDRQQCWYAATSKTRDLVLLNVKPYVNAPAVKVY